MTRDPCCTQKESGRLNCAPSAAPSSDSPPPGGHSAPCQPGLLGSERALPALWCCVLGWPRALRPQAGERQRGLRSPHLPSDSAKPRARRCRSSPNPSPGPRPPHTSASPSPGLPARRTRRRTQGPSAQRPLPQPRLGAAPIARATCKRPPRNFSQLHRGPLPPQPPRLPLSPPPIPNPRNKQSFGKAPFPCPPPSPLLQLRGLAGWPEATLPRLGGKGGEGDTLSSPPTPSRSLARALLPPTQLFAAPTPTPELPQLVLVRGSGLPRLHCAQSRSQGAEAEIGRLLGLQAALRLPSTRGPPRQSSPRSLPEC